MNCELKRALKSFFIIILDQIIAQKNHWIIVLIHWNRLFELIHWNDNFLLKKFK